MNTETIKLTQVSKNEKNPRKISDGNLNKLINSILVFPNMLELRPIVIDDALEYIRNLEPGFKKVVLLEGDRLLNERFIDEIKAEVIIINASTLTLLKRHIERGDNQSETFLKRCETKINNIIKKYNLKPNKNNDLYDREIIVQMLVERANNWLNL